MLAALTARQTQVRVAAIFGGIAALFAATGFAVRWEHAERHGRAARHFSRANALDRQHRLADALREYRTAVLIDREREEYQLGLADALRRAGRPAEAEAYLRSMLERNPAHGRANLALARIRAQQVLTNQESADAADAAYRRAIAGDWPPPGPGPAPRLEWVAFLGETRRSSLQTAQLLILAQELPGSEARRLAAAAALAPAASEERRQLIDRLRAAVQP
jgi:tetratricopeptide (TPR) repeat protein